MADMNNIQDQLYNQKQLADILASTVTSLGTIFNQESERLGRESEVRQLETLVVAISHKIEEAKHLESSAESSDNQRQLMSSAGRLFVGGIIKMVSNTKQPSAIADSLLNIQNKQIPYGKVLVYVGSKGIPEDVGFVSISRLARGTNRFEHEVVKELQNRGHLLFRKEEFTILMDRLIDAVKGGRLKLPISSATVSAIIKLK